MKLEREAWKRNKGVITSTPNSEFLDPKKKFEIESWLEDIKIVDPLVNLNDVEYIDTFPTLKELGYHEWLLKYPKPSWVKEKIRIKNLNNIKISCMIGHFLKRQAYINLESSINVMSKQQCKQIMSKGLESRQKPSNPNKNSNFVGRIAQPVMNTGQDRQIQNVGGNSGNHFGQYAGQVVQNQQGFNAWQNGGI
nr:hypothetical protein [Tanacetum cinerariifolium]